MAPPHAMRSGDTDLAETLRTTGLTAPAPVAVEFVNSSAPRLMDAVRELWSYRELFFFLAWRDITIRYRQTLLGAAWAVVQPIVTMVVFTFLFGVVVKVPTNGIPAPIFYLSALLPWLYFAATIAASGNSLVGNGYLIKKIYFPRVVLPASGALVGLVDFGIGVLILIAMMAYYGVLSWSLLLWVPLTALLCLFSFAVGTLLSALNVKYRDVKHAIPFLVQIWLFLTPVIYPSSSIPKRFQLLITLNPLTGIIEAFRTATVPSAPLDWGALGISTGIALVVLLAGLAYFRQAEGYFSDIV
jgi:lipopolysaccharide transport system permease protein